MTSSLHNRKMSISLKRKKIFQKEKRHSSVFWKAFQISTKNFSFHRHFNNSMIIFERSLRNLLKDLSKIFVRILQDLQGFDQDLAKILGKILTGSLLDPSRSLRIL